MKNHFDLTDKDFENSFEDCSLNPVLFGHEAHLRLAWIHVRKYGEARAIQNVTTQLQKFVVFNGENDKYNHTLTVAAIKAISHFIKKSSSHNFKDFMIAFPRLKNNFKDLMSSHYALDIFTSEKAKKEYIEPDLLPFD